jgi:hypothetical protein
MSDGQWAEWHRQEEDARRDALATAKEDRHVTEHTHHFMGQELRHSHPGGQDEHGYFEHPEDGARVEGTPPLAVELAEVIRAQKMAGVDMVRSAPGELRALRNLAAAVQAQLLAQPEPAPWRALAAERSELIDHLHTHPDHAGSYPAGHDFVLVSTADIRRSHQRQHGEE